MRVKLNNDQDAGSYAAWLLTIGNGEVEILDDNFQIQLNKDLIEIVDSLDELIQKVYKDFAKNKD